MGKLENHYSVSSSHFSYWIQNKVRVRYCYQLIQPIDWSVLSLAGPNWSVLSLAGPASQLLPSWLQPSPALWGQISGLWEERSPVKEVWKPGAQDLAEEEVHYQGWSYGNQPSRCKWLLSYNFVFYKKKLFW